MALFIIVRLHVQAEEMLYAALIFFDFFQHETGSEIFNS
jgi:hypothetical protein